MLLPTSLPLRFHASNSPCALSSAGRQGSLRHCRKQEALPPSPGSLRALSLDSHSAQYESLWYLLVYSLNIVFALFPPPDCKFLDHVIRFCSPSIYL